MERSDSDLPDLRMDRPERTARGVTLRGTAAFPGLGPWYAEFTARVSDGQIVIASVTVDLDPIEAANPSGAGLLIPKGGLTTRRLHSVNLGALLRAIRVQLQSHELDYLFPADSLEGQVERELASQVEAEIPGASAARERSRQAAADVFSRSVPHEEAPAQKAGRPVQRTDEFYQEVAEIRLVFQALGRTGATKAIAERFGIAISTAETYLSQAKSRGWLQPGEVGQPNQTRNPGPALLNAWAEQGRRLDDAIREFERQERKGHRNG